mgnify:CR=1 FL=1
MLGNNKFIHFFYLIIDILLISVAFAAPYYFNLALMPVDLEGRNAYFSVFLFWGICLIFVLNIFNLYKTSRDLSISKEFFVVGKCVGYTSILAALFIFLLKIDIFSRVVFIESAFLLFFVIASWRFIKRIFVRQLVVKGFSNYNVLFIGANSETEMLIQEIIDNPFLGLRIAGIVDDKKTGGLADFRILGGFEKLEYIIKKYFIDEIYIAGNSSSHSMQEIIARCVKSGKTVKLLVNDFGVSLQKLSLGYLGTVPLVTYFEGVPVKANGLRKQIWDICISGLLLILFSPVFIIIALCIKLETKGPVFYVAQRSGKKGAGFNFYKFRSMVYNADNLKNQLISKSEGDGPIFKIKDDPRITRVGRFLRRYSLDELPQLINVFKGDMSLVGPRPFPVEESNRIEYKHIPRLNIKPGVTGLAQIKGRSDLKFHNWMRWDTWYVKNWSLGLDLKILLWTIPAVLRGRGAY